MIIIDQAIHKLRVIAGFGLAGAVLAGAALGWIPALNAVGLHEIGGFLGVTAGTIASAKNYI